jgi:hypothetical protein
LELAAKAAGIDLYWSEDDPECDWVQGSYPRIPDHRVLEKWTWKTWNPLTDDGDALRLAVKLHMLEEGISPFVELMWRLGTETGTDDYAATRRAITRAAAQIGKEIK